MDNRSDRDELWELMGCSPLKRAPSGFAAEVVREIRRGEPCESSPALWFRWLVPGFAAAILAMVMSLSGGWGGRATTVVSDQDLAEMIGVGQLIADSSRTAWADLEQVTPEN
ncbi:MAG: hypothetical protein Fur0032_16170 [Terrimicrobiaceae bacterium]